MRCAEGVPGEAGGAVGGDGAAALALEEIEGIEREEAAVPLGAGEGGVGAALLGEVAGGVVGVEGDRFHHLVIEGDGLGGIEGDLLFVEGVLQAHDAEADGAVLLVGVAGGFDGVEIDVDDVVEHPHDDGDGLAELGVDRWRRRGGGAPAILMLARLQTATSSEEVLSSISVQRFELWMMPQWSWGLRTLARVLPGEPGVAGLEEGLEHALPEGEHAHLAAPDLALGGEALVGFVLRPQRRRRRSPGDRALRWCGRATRWRPSGARHRR